MTSREETISIIPRPEHVERRDGSFTISSNTRLVFDPRDEAARRAADHLVETIARSTGVRFGTNGAQPISFLHSSDQSPGADGYELDVTPSEITVRASSSGFFNAVQSLLQLLPAQALRKTKRPQPVELTLPCLRITDRPRFAWRGLMLDVCRHFLSVDDVLRTIDAMALHKLNVLHLHLTDDHGWRIEINKHPKLTKIGAWRNGIGFGLDPKFSTMYDARGRYGGFLTQDEVRGIVGYAADRNITVVPEIEMPGHAQAALAAYPELSCTGGPFDVSNRAGVHDDVYCAGNDQVFALLQDVLDEVLPLFPSTFVHIGGDECPKTRWKECPKCQARIRDEGLKDEHELQSWFVRRMERFLNGRGRRLIGWDEILEGGLAPNATVMSWRGVDGGIAAAKARHDVVMSPTSNCYLDYPQRAFGEPRAIGSVLTLEKVYAYEPIPPELSADQARHVLGVQANLWTEYVPDLAHAEYMTWPRAAALAEVAWSAPDAKDFADFERRLASHLPRLAAIGVTYRIPDGGASCAIEPGGAPGEAIVGGAERDGVHVTLDGSEPTPDSPGYAGPFTLDRDTRLIRAAYFDPRGTGRAYADAFVFDGHLCRLSAFIHGWQRSVLRHITLDAGRLTFDSNEPLGSDDHVTVTFVRPTSLREIRVMTGDGEAAQFTRGVLEMSTNGVSFAQLADFEQDGRISARIAAGAPVHAFRLRATEPQDRIVIAAIEMS